MDGGFQGDGHFVGDGGATLQALWEAWTWKMIPNCPGRYVTKKNKVLAAMPLEDLVGLLNNNVDGTSGGTQDIRVIHTTSDTIVDAVHVAVFPDGGGVITYCKPSGAFVHTLNTQSGLERKLAGLRLSSCLHD
ncbi:hypothetical protein H257_16168 [Aphanomyces astaci]|uniref:Uncharacterized protein n=1 Tax=Aphanomyces astaci TaxID=112090 RepID=W4FJL8_APHAT|nr:hypothetical protein H257_16168 [Aphanomyces astaci]ETV67702.1 hypothetical protein H257_16168 [Aphanomyces astaci]|eukprot:XP_009842823.1 hypothetical protein H257_16168 [Aphanomyces astaci]